MLRSTIVVSTLLAVAGSTSLAADIPRHGSPHVPLTTHGFSYTPGIRIWTNGSDLHRRGDRVRLYYRTERDAYVMIFRVDTDGRVQVLYPRNPNDESYGAAGNTYSVANYDRDNAFAVDDDPGVGYLFGVASIEPFDLHEVLDENGGWDLRGVTDGRIHGDPMQSMEELVQTLMPTGYADFDTHLLPYYVGERRYDYPRFVCYDCHTYTPYARWDPYADWCRSYTLTVFNDPYYYYPSYWYPTQYYGGTRVVYVQPQGSRYVFKTRDNGSSPGIDYRDRRYTSRTASATGRGPEGRGVRGIDLGGTGSVPAPRTPTRREAPPLGEGGGGGGGGGGGERPREPRNAGYETQRPTGSQPSTATPDGSRRRVDAQPGIQIVPRSSTPSTGERREASGERVTGGDGNEPRPARPAYREGTTQTRNDAPQSRQAESRPAESRQPESVRQPETRQPEARQPETRQPEARQPSARQPESRPQSAPQASPPRESRPPESRPQHQPQSSPPKTDPGLVRRRP